MPTDYGSGIFLTSQADSEPVWDIRPDASGDLETVSGIDELEKDLAVASAVRLTGRLGARMTPLELNRIRGAIFDVFEDEERIESVSSVELIPDNAEDKLTIIAEVNAVTEGDVELVFEVTE